MTSLYIYRPTEVSCGFVHTTSINIRPRLSDLSVHQLLLGRLLAMCILLIYNSSIARGLNKYLVYRKYFTHSDTANPITKQLVLTVVYDPSQNSNY